MFLDIVLVILLVLAIIKGFQRGLIVGVFSLVAIIVGLAAALKLSVVAARYIGEAVNISNAWLPIVSFAIVFILVVLLVRLGAGMLQRSVEWTMLGWVNRLGGIILYVCLFVLVYSVILFYASQVNLINEESARHSMSYQYIQPLGPAVIDGFGSIIPLFRDMFADLQEFFDGIAHRAPAA
jgi:Uncharacterized membrane protein, required for colicin V production